MIENMDAEFSQALFLFFFLTVILGKDLKFLVYFTNVLAPTIGIFIILNCIQTYQKVREKEQARRHCGARSE